MSKNLPFETTNWFSYILQGEPMFLCGLRQNPQVSPDLLQARRAQVVITSRLLSRE